MRKEIGSAISVLAASAAFAAPNEAKAATTPSPQQIEQAFSYDYTELSSSAIKFAKRKLVAAKNIAATFNPAAVKTPEGTINGTAVDLSIGTYNKKRHAIQEADIEVIVPDTPTAVNTVPPGSLFQVELYQTHGSKAPKTIADYNKVINHSTTNINDYSFAMSVQADKGYPWNINSDNKLFSTSASETYYQPVSTHYYQVISMINQCGLVLQAVEHNQVVPKRDLVNLEPTQTQ